MVAFFRDRVDGISQYRAFRAGTEVLPSSDAVAQLRVGVSFALVVALLLTVVEQITLPVLAELSQGKQFSLIVPFVRNAGRIALGFSLLLGWVGDLCGFWIYIVGKRWQ